MRLQSAIFDKVTLKESNKEVDQWHLPIMWKRNL